MPRYVSKSGTLWKVNTKKGRAETQLLQFAADTERQGLWQTYIMRPSMIMPKEPSLVQKILGYLLGSVKVDDLGRASIKLAVAGQDLRTLENDDLSRTGRRA